MSFDPSNMQTPNTAQTAFFLAPLRLKRCFQRVSFGFFSKFLILRGERGLNSQGMGEVLFEEGIKGLGVILIQKGESWGGDIFEIQYGINIYLFCMCNI